MWTKLKKCLIKHQERRVAYWRLQQMSDKTLKDMGLTRNEIYQKVYGNQSR